MVDGGDTRCAVCGACAVVEVLDPADRLCLQLGQLTWSPECEDCLGRGLEIKALLHGSRDLRLRALVPKLELAPDHFTVVDHDAGAGCVHCATTDTALVSVSNCESMSTPALCSTCLGLVVVAQLHALPPGEHDITVGLRGRTQARRMGAQFWDVQQGPHHLRDEGVAVPFGRVIGEIYCSDVCDSGQPCQNTLVRLGVSDGALVAHGWVPAEGQGEPDARGIGWAVATEISSDRFDEERTVLSCWKGHSGRVVTVGLCRNVRRNRQRSRSQRPVRERALSLSDLDER